MRITPNIYITLILLCYCLLHTTAITAQPEQLYNRFQWHKYKWRTFHTKAFHVYFPAGYDSACAYIVRELPFAMKKVKHNMTTTLLKEPNVIIYPSQDQLYESNIGLYEPERYPFPTFLQTGNRMVIAYTGSYEDLKQQLYETIARSIWDNQLKEDLKDQLKGAEANNKKIPYWFKEGAIRYFAHGWPIDAEDQLQKSFRQQHFQSWDASISYQPRLSGQAFCYFLNQWYYPQATTQAWQQMKKKDLYRALRLITKKPMDTLFHQCLQFYANRFATPIIMDSTTGTHYNTRTIPRKKGILVTQQLSPGGTYLAYTTSRNNKRTLYTCDLNTRTTHKITTYNLPPWINDYSKDPYPLIEWKTDRELIVTDIEKGKLTINRYTPAGSILQKNHLPAVDGIRQLQADIKDNTVILSAYRKGQSDIVAYDMNRERYAPYTSDPYDDGNFTITGNGTLIFQSNRPEKEIKKGDTLRLQSGLYQLKGKSIQPYLKDTPAYNHWDHPQNINDNRVLATNTLTGTEAPVIINSNKDYIPLSTNQSQPYQYLSGKKEIALYTLQADSITITSIPVANWIEQNREQAAKETPITPWLTDYLQTAAEQARTDSILRAAKDDNPTFLEGVLVPKNAKEQAKAREDSISRSLDYYPKKVKPYILQLHSAYFTARVNNDYFINRYQPYLNYQGMFKFPEVGGMVQGGFTDLFENHHINIAFRLPAGSEGSDFFFRYRNTAKKWDWGLEYFRKVESLQPDPKREWVDKDNKPYQPYPGTAKVKTHYYSISLRCPITYYLSAGIQTAVRMDRTIFLATEDYSLKFEDIKSTWSINTLDLDYHKLQPTIPLLHKGYSAKLMADIFKGFSQEEPALLGLQLKGEYDLPIYKYITLVAKAQAGYSKGDNYLLYNLGGTDNNLVPKTDTTVHFPQSAPYAFQTLVTPFRGYLQNRLYGNTYAVANADIYFPLFQTLIPIETPLNFINLLQPGIFTDAGTAKETWNKTYAKQGILWSYGLSLRTTLANYPLRLDVAWPGTFSKKPVWYFSLNLK